MFGQAPASVPTRIGILLIPRFSMMAFASVIEPLRVANRLSGRKLYEWRLYSADGEPVVASSDIPTVCEEGLTDTAGDTADDTAGDTDWPQALFVCAGLDSERFHDRRIFAWLRERSRAGIALGAISTGSLILARAGLLRGYRCTIHWEQLGAFTEEFPELEITGRIFEIDRDRYTCAGGTAALDMMLYAIGVSHGHELATEVSSQFIHDRVRTPSDQQRMVNKGRLRNMSPKLAAAIDLMEAHLEAPLSTAQIAKRVAVSPRQLERLFRKHRSRSPREYYITLRLQHARLLLLQTDMSILGVALASGFETQSHFTKCYREHFGRTPKQERGGINTRF